jgi:hypothetical protein
MAAADGQVIRVPTLGSHAVVEISVSGGTNAMDLIPRGGAAVQDNDGQPDNGLIGLVERTLDGMELKYLREREEVFCMMSESDGATLWVQFLVVGDERNILRITCTDNRPVPKCHWQRAFAICNAYHATYRFGRIYLAVEEGQSGGMLRFDAQLLVPEAVTEDFVKHFIYANLVCAHEFFGTAGRGPGSSAGADQPVPPRERLPAAGQKRKGRKPGFARD